MIDPSTSMEKKVLIMDTTKALEALNAKIKDGEEFPEASYSVALCFKVPYADLLKAYDDQF